MNKISYVFKVNLCQICSLKANFRCSKCQNVHYCSKEHQEFHWNIACHRNMCSLTTMCLPQENEHVEKNEKTDRNWSSIDTQIIKDNCQFKEWEIVCDTIEDEEIMENDKKMDVNEKTELDDRMDLDDMDNKKRYKKSKILVETDEKYETSKVKVDSAFLKFQKMILKNQTSHQVLR